MAQNKPGNIPQTDPKASYLAHKAEIDAAVQRVLGSGWYILGQEVQAFEEAFAVYIGIRHAIAAASGTDALELALRACGVGPGDLVFTVSHTAVATVAAIELTGATPVLVDIDPTTYTMDPRSLTRALDNLPGGQPKAVVPVHLYGQPADMPAILEVAARHGMKVIEDCAQSHGASLNGLMTGVFGDMAAFSFYPTKNLGALGDGGMIVTDDSHLAEQVRLLQQYGWKQRYVSEIPGGNSRLDEIQAAILRVKLDHLERDTLRRCDLARLYNTLLDNTALTLPTSSSEARHVYHQFVIRSRQRDALATRLKQCGVCTGIHYPVPIHLQPAYFDRLPRVVDLSHSEQAAGEILSLPMFPQLTDEQVHTICTVLNEICDGERKDCDALLLHLF